MTLETVQGNSLLKQDRNKHQCRRLLLQRLSYQRECIDVEPGPYDKSCFEVPNKMIRLLRHDPSVLREEDGAIEFRILVNSNKAEVSFRIYVFQHWSIRTWLADTILYRRAIQGHSGGKHINLTLLDNVLLPSGCAEYIYHVGSSHDTHSVIQSGLIPGGKDVKKGIHAVFFTAVHRSLSREGLRRDEARECSVQTQSEAAPKYSI